MRAWTGCVVSRIDYRAQRELTRSALGRQERGENVDVRLPGFVADRSVSSGLFD